MLKRRLALLVAALALLAGGTAVALGATGSSHHSGRRHAHAGTGHGLLAAASAYLGVPAGRLRSEVASGKTLAQIAAATPGKSETGLVSALVAAGEKRLRSASAKLSEKVQAIVRGKAGSFERRRLAAGRRRGSLRAAVLAYLGLDRKALAADLRSGRTLAQIAGATPGKSAAALGQTLLEAASKRLGAKHMSKSIEAARLARLKTRIQDLLSRSHAGLRSQHTPTGAG